MGKTLTSALGSPSAVPAGDDIVLVAMRLAERAHREINHFRKAPGGEDRPAYFLHLAEVAWMLKDAGMSDEIVAAGYLHDMIEDCGYTRDQLTEALGNNYVAELVERVSEPDKENSWEDRNQAYLEGLQGAPDGVLALSCADKTSNIMDMIRMLEKGYHLDDFMSRGIDQQVKKFNALSELFAGKVPGPLYQKFHIAFSRLKELTSKVDTLG